MSTLQRMSLLAPGSLLKLDDVDEALCELDSKILDIERQLSSAKADDTKWLNRATYSLRQSRQLRAQFLLRREQLVEDHASRRFMAVARRELPPETFAAVLAKYEQVAA